MAGVLFAGAGMRAKRFMHPSNGNLSKSRQRQYITLHCLSILGDHVRTCKHHIPPKTKAALERIERRRVGMLDIMGEVSEKSRTLVKNRFAQAMAHFDMDSPISPEEHINACLYMVETLREQGAKPKQEWDYLAQSLGTLYSHLDKFLSDQEAMDKGELVATTIFKEFG